MWRGPPEQDPESGRCGGPEWHSGPGRGGGGRGEPCGGVWSEISAGQGEERAVSKCKDERASVELQGVSPSEI